MGQIDRERVFPETYTEQDGLGAGSGDKVRIGTDRN